MTTKPKIGFKPVHGENSSAGQYIRTKLYCWDGKPMRCPKKNEFYLSGAIPTAYRAPTDLTTEYFIAIPTNIS
jgi:hypothetical protein